MSENNVIDLKDPSLLTTDPLTELLRQGAHKLIEQAVESELEMLLNKHSNTRSDNNLNKCVMRLRQKLIDFLVEKVYEYEFWVSCY